MDNIKYIKEGNDRKLLSYFIDKMEDDLRIIDIMPSSCSLKTLDLLLDVFSLTKDMTAKEKRKLLANAFEVSKSVGSVFAVEKAVSAFLKEFELVEWFYTDDMKPNTFKIKTPNSNGFKSNDYKKIIENVERFKNVKCRLDSITITGRTETKLYTGSMVAANIKIRVRP
jgi:phage tail P2-like protein